MIHSEKEYSTTQRGFGKSKVVPYKMSMMGSDLVSCYTKQGLTPVPLKNLTLTLGAPAHFTAPKV